MKTFLSFFFFFALSVVGHMIALGVIIQSPDWASVSIDRGMANVFGALLWVYAWNRK